MPQRGQAVPIDDAWRAEVKKRCKDRGWSLSELARVVRCRTNAITRLINGEHNQSPLVPRIERALGMEPRIRQDVTDLEREIAALVRGATTEEQRIALGILKAILQERRR